jgi:hypothetical protein
LWRLFHSCSFSKRCTSSIPIYIVGSLSCPATYINTLTKETTFNVEDAEQIELLSRNSKEYLLDPTTAINCIFEERYSPDFKPDLGSFFSLQSFLNWLDTNPIQVAALRDIEEGEELFVSYNMSQNPETDHDFVPES